MSVVPNLDVLTEQSKKLDEEFDLEARLSRYSSAAPELLSFAANEGLSNDNDAARALFVSDFVVTSSEVPIGSDEDRHRSIIKTFTAGMTSRCESSDKLLRVYYLAYKTAVLIRRQDLFMGGRGLDRKTSLIRLYDSYIIPYLAVSKDLLGSGSCGWELSILAAALAKNYPDIEMEKYKQAPDCSKAQMLISYIWLLLETYEKQKIIEKDDKIVLPNVPETKSVLVLDTTKDSMISKWNTVEVEKKPSRDQEILKLLTNFLQEMDSELQLISFRCKISGTDERLILVRDPTVKSKPFFFLRTTVPEINVTKTLTILNRRGLENKGWLEVDYRPEEPESVTEPEEEEVEIEVEEEEEVEVPEPEIEQEPEVADQVVEKIGDKEEKKGGLLSRFFARLSGKQSKSKEPSKTAKTVKKSPKKKMKKVKKKVTKIKKVKRPKKKPEPVKTLPPLSHALTVDIVSNIDLFEAFDTFRESKYIVLGIFDTEHDKKTTSFYADKKLIDPTTTGKLLEGLGDTIVTAGRYFFGTIDAVLPEELFFVSKDDKRRIICLATSELERTVGIVAETFVKDVTDWKWSKDKEEQILQRRTLHMRAGQLLAARRHTKMDEAVQRIFDIPDFETRFELHQIK
ncbi:MAG: hypothetical protein ACFFD4_11940 [Candidatus Odinarchaeota archaeon]